jgi:type I restriction enzyme M protein
LWFMTRNRSGKLPKGSATLRDRRAEILFIDARGMGQMVSRVHRELADGDIATIAGTYHAWRGEKNVQEYEDVPGFCRSVSLEELLQHGGVLTPGRYVGAAAPSGANEPFDIAMARLSSRLRQESIEADRLGEQIAKALSELGFDV